MLALNNHYFAHGLEAESDLSLPPSKRASYYNKHLRGGKLLRVDELCKPSKAWALVGARGGDSLGPFTLIPLSRFDGKKNKQPFKLVLLLLLLCSLV